MLKARDESMVTPSSLILSDMGMSEPLTSTWVMLSSDLLRGWVPRRMASDFSGIKGKTIVIEPGSEMYEYSFEVAYPVRGVTV